MNRQTHLHPDSFHSRFCRKVFIVLFLTMICLTVVSCSRETNINQKKIERDRAKKQKQAVKEYEKAVKHHNQIQSKSTKSSMKKSKKESSKLTPVNH